MNPAQLPGTYWAEGDRAILSQRSGREASQFAVAESQAAVGQSGTEGTEKTHRPVTSERAA